MLQPAPRITYFTATDGYRFAVRVWDAQGAVVPRCYVACLHGIVSHGGWYNASCRELARSGCEVHFLDRRGAGLNFTGRGDIDRWETWATDVEAYLTQLPTGPPIVLVGVSWGGKLATAVVRRRPDLVVALGLICPGLFPKHATNAMQRVALRTAAALKLNDWRVTIPLEDPKLFTGNSSLQPFVETDPLALRTVTIRFALADMELTHYATEAPNEISATAALLALSGEDQIIDNAKTRRFFDGLRTSQRSLFVYEQAGHTLEFEPDSEEYLHDLREWIFGIAGS